MSDFIGESVLFLHSLGFFTIVLPFLLIYVISFGLMVKMNLFQRGKTNDHAKYNSMIAFCLAFFTISAVDLTESLPLFIALIAFLFIGLLAINILLGMLGGNDSLRKGNGKTIYIGFISLYLLFAVIQVFFDWDVIYNFLKKSGLNSLIPVIAFIAIFLGIVYWVTRDSGSSSSSKSEDNSSSSKDSSSKKSKKQLPKGEVVSKEFNVNPSKDIKLDDVGFGKMKFD